MPNYEWKLFLRHRLLNTKFITCTDLLKDLLIPKNIEKKDKKEINMFF